MADERCQWSSGAGERVLVRGERHERSIGSLRHRLPRRAATNEVERGREVVIARAGRPIARLVPAGPLPRRELGIERGEIWIADDFDADRILAAQAMAENLPLVTADPPLTAYDIEVIRA